LYVHATLSKGKFETAGDDRSASISSVFRYDSRLAALSLNFLTSQTWQKRSAQAYDELLERLPICEPQ